MKTKKLNMNRRNFLRFLSIGTAHILVSPLYGTPYKYVNADPLQKVKLGNSGIETTLVGFGTGINGVQREAFLVKQDKQKSIALLLHAWERGIRYFDCADSYGTHGLMAEALKQMDRERLTLTTKIWVREDLRLIPEPERPDANIVVDRFRRELNTDYLDIVQLHCLIDGNWTDSQKRQMDILDNLKAKGIIKAHGVSVHSIKAMKAAVECPWVDVIHVRINPYGMAMNIPEIDYSQNKYHNEKINPDGIEMDISKSEELEEVVQVIHKLHHAGKGVIGMKLIGGGLMQNDSEKINNTLRFVLGLGSVDMIVIGFEGISQVDDYLNRTKNTLYQLKTD